MRRMVPRLMKRKRWVVSVTVLAAACALISVPLLTEGVSAFATGPSFLEFESGQVRPIAMSPDGTKLFAVNTPNNTLEIFNITSSGLAFQGRVPVGLEP